MGSRTASEATSPQSKAGALGAAAPDGSVPVAKATVAGGAGDESQRESSSTEAEAEVAAEEASESASTDDNSQLLVTHQSDAKGYRPWDTRSTSQAGDSDESGTMGSRTASG